MNKRLYDLPVEKRQKEFQKIKKRVLKRYPNATTQANSDGRFYLTDGYGSFPEGCSIPTLWLATHDALETSEFPFGQVIRISK